MIVGQPNASTLVPALGRTAFLQALALAFGSSVYPGSCDPRARNFRRHGRCYGGGSRKYVGPRDPDRRRPDPARLAREWRKAKGA